MLHSHKGFLPKCSPTRRLHFRMHIIQVGAKFTAPRSLFASIGRGFYLSRSRPDFHRFIGHEISHNK